MIIEIVRFPIEAGDFRCLATFTKGQTCIFPWVVLQFFFPIFLGFPIVPMIFLWFSHLPMARALGPKLLTVPQAPGAGARTAAPSPGCRR